MNHSHPRILYCVLNWGLGHATRSIPVIRSLLEAGFVVEIASDGGPLRFLQRTFPELVTHILPGYNIYYPSRNVFVNALSQMLRMRKAVNAERNAIHQLIARRRYDAIISDNRYGCHHASLPSFLITHQLCNLVRTPVLSKPGEWIIARFARHFNEIWVPDTPDRALSGKMTDLDSPRMRFIGHLSDQEYHPLEMTYYIAAVLSGPEPQRAHLEREVLPQLLAFSGPCALVRGVIEEMAPEVSAQVTTYPYLDRKEVNAVLNSSEVVLCRAGYSSLMDLLQVGRKAILIPTPGQPEQEYLGKQMKGHPQFVVQKQGSIDIRLGYRELLARPAIVPAHANLTLLHDALQTLPGINN